MGMIKENWKFLEYTYLHRKALKYLVETLIINPEDKKALRKRAEIHDLNKALMYTIYPKSMASEMHRRHAAHHMENDTEKSQLDFMEAVLDYECAALTKPDKSLNAYDTVKNIPNRYADELIEIMKELGIDRSYIRKADDAFNAFMADYLPVTEEKVLSEIYSYVGRIFECRL